MYKTICILYIVGPVRCRNVMYFPIIAQKRQVRAKLYWTKEMIPDGDPSPQEQMKGTRNDKKGRLI